MKTDNNILNTLKVVTLALMLSIGIGYISAAAPSSPPSCPAGWVGCDAPLNQGFATQTKSGGLLSSTIFSSPLAVFGKIGVGITEPVAELDVDGEIHATGDVCTDSSGTTVCLGGDTDEHPAIRFLASPVEYSLPWNTSGITEFTLSGGEVLDTDNAVIASVIPASDARIKFYTPDNIFVGGSGGRVGAGTALSQAGSQIIVPVRNRKIKYITYTDDGHTNAVFTVLGIVNTSSRTPVTVVCSRTPSTPTVPKNTQIVWISTVTNGAAGTTYSWKGTSRTQTSFTSSNDLHMTYTTTGVKTMTSYISSGASDRTDTCPSVTITAS
jgi:hypothetical protein